MAKDLNFAVQFDTQAAADDFKKLFEAYIAGSKRAGDAANAALGGTVTKKVELRLEADSKGQKVLTSSIKEARTELDKYERAYRNATKTQAGSVTSVRQQLNQARQARDAVAKFNQEIDRSNRGIVFSARLSPEWLAAESRVKGLQQELRNLEAAGGTALDRIGASFDLGRLTAFGKGISDIVNIFQSLNIIAAQVIAPIKAVTGALAELQSFGLSFQAIGQGASGATKALSDAQSIALGLGVSIQTVREGFKQLSPVIINSGGNLGNVSDIVKSLSSRFAAFGLNADKSRRVLNGVIQAFAKGKLQAEELTQQISEADPAFKTDFANALFASADALTQAGGKTGELGKKLQELAKKGEEPITALEGLVKQGQITTDVLIQILPQLSKANLLFGKLGPTANTAVDALQNGSAIISQVEANIANLNQLNLEKFAKLAEPLVVTFLRAQAIVTDFITRILEIRATKDLVSIFNSIGEAVLRVLNALTALAEGFLQLASAVTPVISALAAIPGVLELIGLSIIGRFLNPLNQLKGGLAENLVIQNKFIEGLKKAWQNTGPAVDDYRSKIEKLSQKLTTPLAVNTILDTAKPNTDITDTRVKQEENANKRIKADTSKTLDDVTSRYRQYVSDINQLEKKKTGDLAKPLRQQLAEQTSLIQEARKEYASLPEAAQKKIGGEAFTPIDTSSIKNISNASAELKALIDRYNRLTGDLVDRPELAQASSYTGSLFIRSIRELESELKAFASSNPDEAYKILSLGAKIASTDVEKNSKAFQDSVAKSRQVISSLASALPERGLVSGDIVDDASIAKAEQLQQKIKGLEGEIAKTQASLASPVLSFTEKEEKRLTKLRGRLRETQLEYRALQNASSVPAATTADTGASARLDQLRKQSTAQQDLSNQTKSRLLAEKTASSARIAYYNREIAIKERDIQITRRFIQEQAKQGKQVDVTGLRQQEDALIKQRSQRALAIQALAAQAAAESDLTAAQAKASRTGATLNDQLNYAKVALNNAQTSFINLTKKVNDAEGALASASSRLASLTNIGGTSRRTSDQLREIIDLRQQIPQLANNLDDLRKQQAAAGITASDLGSAYNSLNGDIKKTSGLFPTFSRGLGLIKSGASGIGGALKNAFAGAALGAKSLLSGLGPIEIILIGAAVATRAYNDANAVTAQVTSESANRVKALDAALKELGSTTQQGEKPISGFALAWIRLSYVIKDTADALGKIFAPALDFAAGGISGFISSIGNLAVALAAGAVAGAALGATILGIGAVPGAFLGAAVAGVIALSSAGNDADVKLRKLKDRLSAIGASAQVENAKIQQLIAKLRELQFARDKDAKAGKSTTTADANINKNFVVARDGVKALTDQLNDLKQQQGIVNAEIDKMQLSPKAKTAREEIARLKKEVQLLEAAQARQGYRAGKGGQDKTTERIRALREEITKLEEIAPSSAQQKRFDELNKASAALSQEITGLKGILEPTIAELNAFAAATGRVADPVNEATSSIGQLDDIIEKLKEGAKTYNLASALGRANYDQDINKANRLKGILEFLSKTKWEINLETTKVQNELNQAQLDINLEPGSFRESQKLASEVGADITTASQTFLNKVQAARDLAAENPKFAQQAGEYIKLAAQEYLVSTRAGAAKIIEAGRKFKEDLDQARSGLQDLRLNKPEFFAPEEIRQNALQIEQDYTAALAKVRERFPDFTPKLDTSSSDSLLKSKKDFVDTRKEADKLENTMKQAADALTVAAAALAKLAGIEIKDLGSAGAAFAKLTDGSKNNAKNAEKAKADFSNYANGLLATDQKLSGLGTGAAQGGKRVGEVLGKLSVAQQTYKDQSGKSFTVPGRELVLYYDNLTGKVEEVTSAEFKRLQAADKANAASSKGAQQGVTAVSGLVPASNQAAAAITGIGQSTEKSGSTIVSRMVNGVAVISNIGATASKAGSQLGSAFSGAIKPLNSYVKGLNGAGSAEQERQAFIDKLQKTGQEFAAGPGATVVFGTKVEPPNEQLIRQAAQQANGDFSRALSSLEAQGFNIGAPTGGPAAEMSSWAADALDYAVAIDTARTAQAQLSQATVAYEQAKAAGYSTDELEVYRAGVQNAQDALASATVGVSGLKDQEQAWNSASEAAKRYGINIESIPNVSAGMSDLGVAGPTLQSSMEKASLTSETAATNTENLAGSMQSAAEAGQRFADAIKNIPNDINLNGTITINNSGPQNRWAGGPVAAGATYRVNEIGQEGFLSRTGNLSAITKPRNALWKPTSSGTVIPASIWSKLKSTNAGVQGAPVRVGHTGAKTSSMKAMINMLNGYLVAQSIASNGHNSDLKRIQSHQAVQIGKLAKAVDNLAQKNWNVGVKVRNTGSTTFLDAMNRAL